jgi:hypothetical protein
MSDPDTIYGSTAGGDTSAFGRCGQVLEAACKAAAVAGSLLLCAFDALIDKRGNARALTPQYDR